MQLALSFGLGLYFFMYAFEAPVRWVLSMGGADDMIFVRDILLGVPVAIIFVQQLLAGKLHPAYIIYIFMLLLHGTVSLLNIGSPFVVVYSAKMFLSMLAGAVAPPKTFRPSKGALIYFCFLWVATAIGVILDKYFVEFPWVGATTIIGGLEVDISHDWEIQGADKRAGGFMRSSINVAFFEALISFTILFNIRRKIPIVLIALVTGFVIYCTTQKGAIIAYVYTIVLFTLFRRNPVSMLKFSVLFFMAASILLPVIVVQYVMPGASGVFSMESFYDRTEQTWPDAWTWINQRQIFPLGVGLGGIGAAQRFYSPDSLNYADNLFILLYAFFGVMTFVYLGWIAAKVIQLRSNTSRFGVQALMVLTFLFADGCVLSVIEDQMGGLFFGAALAALGAESTVQRLAQRAKERIVSIPKWRLEADARRKALRDGVSAPAAEEAG